ncbi:MAG TPA: TIGR00266 family protein [Gammaproteobacteria bacterium]|nr:TIGR00266 family protein [Gammaproteobacteria bacterium]HRF43191.1 TIGR00266 family protein [Candidatus Competibacteraceae bacterium]
MAIFTVTGDVDPFLHVSLSKGEKIYCESDAMVMMEDTLDLTGKMTGGLGSALMRRFANGESFFQQHIEANRGDGDCLLSPILPGTIQVLEVGTTGYMLSDGAFVAAESGVDLRVRSQNLGNALFAQSGGFFVGEATGSGKLAVSGFGSGFILDVEPGKDVIIDNSHVVAWDSQLHYEITVPSQQGGGGLFNRLVSSVTSGEGIVLRFSGRGKVVICSRNRNAFSSWVRNGASSNG